jgi:hypothetical protein
MLGWLSALDWRVPLALAATYVFFGSGPAATAAAIKTIPSFLTVALRCYRWGNPDDMGRGLRCARSNAPGWLLFSEPLTLRMMPRDGNHHLRLCRADMRR